MRICTVCKMPYQGGHYTEHRHSRIHLDYNWRLAQRDAAIVAALTDDLSLTFTKVGNIHGLTRERVRQIWKRQTGLTGRYRQQTVRDRPTLCPTCGMPYTGTAHDHRALAGHGHGEYHYLRNREIERLYVEDGLSSVQIGRIYSISAGQVVSLLHRRGVTLKPKGRKGDRYVRKAMVDAER